MYWESALGSAIEVAIAIAGFSGIIAVFGKRDGEGWNAEEKLRMQVLLTSSAAAGLFAFLPFVLFESGLEAETCWRFGSGAQCVFFFGVAVFRVRQASSVGASSSIGFNTLMFPLFLANLAGQILNAAIYSEAWLYLIGVVFQVSVGFITFTTLLLALWIKVDTDDGN